MNSRIFEINDYRIIDKDDHHVFDFEDLRGMPSGVVYVVDAQHREGDIEWFRGVMSRYNGITFDGESFIVSTDFKKEYFKERLKDLKKRVKRLKLDEFSDKGKGMREIYDIKKTIDNELGFRVLSYVHGHMSFDTFVRYMEPNVRYHIGGVGDYRHKENV